MSARLAWSKAKGSLWLLPAILVAAAVALASALVRLDHRLGTDYEGADWFFGGSARGARTVLSVIAGSLISVVAIAFSVTMIALQQAATQYTPRALRNFTRDRVNQLVLGSYVATFTYALLILRSVRQQSEAGDTFVPSISITAGIALALVSLGLLIYFIHHVSQVLQVSHLLRAIRRELDAEIERLYPEPLGRRAEAEPPERDEPRRDESEVVVRAATEGYLREVRPKDLSRAAGSRVRFLRVEVPIGAFVTRGQTLLRAWTRDPSRELEEGLRDAFELDDERSVEEDPLFGLQQIVDIAVKALSPGINDPTTAEQAIDHLRGALSRLLERATPSPLRELQGGAHALFAAPTFDDFVKAAFEQVRRAARADLHVTLHLIRTLRALIAQAGHGSRSECLRAQLHETVAGFDRERLTERERALLVESAGVVPSRGSAAA